MQLRPTAIAAALAGCLAGLCPLGAGAAVERPFPTVTVTGEGTATVRPDRAEATAGVTTEGKSPREASEANTRVMNAVVAAARQAGIAEADIRTARFSIFPIPGRGRDGGPGPTTYRVSNQVHVKIHDLGTVAEVLERLIAAGATNMGEVEFSASEASKLADEARRGAFVDAKRKAELYAQTAGAQLGRVVAIAEEGTEAPRPVFRAASRTGAAAPAAPPISPGEETLRVQITVSFEISQ